MINNSIVKLICEAFRISFSTDATKSDFKNWLISSGLIKLPVKRNLIKYTFICHLWTYYLMYGFQWFSKKHKPNASASTSVRRCAIFFAQALPGISQHLNHAMQVLWLSSSWEVCDNCQNLTSISMSMLYYIMKIDVRCYSNKAKIRKNWKIENDFILL